MVKEALSLSDPLGRVNWYVWRPVLAEHDTYTNVTTCWTLRRLVDSMRVIDFQDAMRELQKDANNS